MASALMSAPAAKAKMPARTRFEKGTNRPSAAPINEEDVVASPSDAAAAISAQVLSVDRLNRPTQSKFLRQPSNAADGGDI